MIFNFFFKLNFNFSSILPHAYSNLEPLCIGNMGALFLTREEYKLVEFEGQDRITFEMCLSLATECRRKMILIVNFLQQNSSKTGSIRPQLMRHKCLRPIRDVLQTFLEEITESVQMKRSTFKGFLISLNIFRIKNGLGLRFQTLSRQFW